MSKNNNFYFSIGINDIPWNRIVDWHGRSSDIPYLLTDLLSDDLDVQKKVIQKLKNKLEHQDGIIMATPFSLIFIFRILALNGSGTKEIIIDILNLIFVILKATKFQLELYPEPCSANIDIQELLSEKYLWPKFVSKKQDEINWEEYDYSTEHIYWLYFTLDIAKSSISAITPYRTNKFHVTVAKNILAILHNS